MKLLEALREQIRGALTGLVSGEIEPLLELVRPAQDPRFGDFQANLAMPLGKQLARPPREVADEIVSCLPEDAMFERPEVAGPGFINFRVRDGWLSEQLQRVAADARLGIGDVETRRTFVVDYSSPNVAKPMHIGHIRSTVIGDALVRHLNFRGHRVIGDNHLGDWGTQFGMIIYGYKHFVDPARYREAPVAELGRLYRLVNQLVEYEAAREALPDRERALEECEARKVAIEEEAEDPADAKGKKRKARLRKAREAVEAAAKGLQETRKQIDRVEQDDEQRARAAEHPGIGRAVLAETARLHQGDDENRALWDRFLPLCLEETARIYQRLQITFDHEYGESFYQDQLDGVVTEFLERGLARESDGAVCVFFDEVDSPMIIRKQDGAFLYSTTDLATIQFRMEKWSPDAMLYVVDDRQSDHFEKLFLAARRWGYKEVELCHVKFGKVLGPDGRPYRTREGAAVALEDILDEAVARAYDVVRENDEAKPDGPELDEDERRRVAEVVGHGAVKYADLSHRRDRDYRFDLEKMVALEGNTAAYLQYACARIQSIFARGGVDGETLREAPAGVLLEEPIERTLGLQLLGFEAAIDEVLENYMPHLLAAYLFELATTFSRFFQQCPVLKAPSDELRASRLLLCDLTGRVLQSGLRLLGIQVVPRM